MENLSFIFLAVTVLAACSGQELDRLHANLQRQSSAVEDYIAHAEDTSALLQDMNKMWTEYFPQLLEESTFLNFTQECIDSTLRILDSPGGLPIGNMTVPVAVITLLDATGKQGAGLLSGNVILDGAYDECFSYDYTAFCLADQITGPKINPLGWTAGFCVPKNCTNHDLTLLIGYSGLFKVEEKNVRCSNSKYPSYSAGAIVMLFVCAAFSVLAVAGTLIDCLLTNIPKVLMGDDDEANDHPSINSDGESESEPLLRRSVVKRAEFQTDKKKVSPLEFITAFSLFKTVPTLLATKQAPSVITSLNGLRVISMFWVILGHTYFWIFIGVSGRIDNFLQLLAVAPRFSFQALVSSFFAVDTFFFLSGVLVAYLTLRQMKGKGKFPFLKYYIHRFLRLTPTYAFVLFFAWFLTVHLASGPELTLKDPFAATCEKYWWTNFLYINNLHPWSLMDGCVSWTWYLANDMQFYVISPLILVPAYYLFPVSLIVASVFVLGGAIITGSLTIAYDFQANTFSGLAYGYVGKVTEKMTYGDAIYIKPWDRIAPYVVGLILGYILFKGVDLKKLRMPRILKLLFYIALWCIAGFILFWLVYGLYFTWHGHTPNRFENFLYIISSRFLWAVCLALIVFACHNGYGWFINSFLSMGIWTPLSRMTFNAYLVHPIVMTVIYGQLQKSLHYTDITIAGFVIMFVVLSYGVAAAICIFVEFPLSTIETLLFNLFGAIRCSKPKNQRYVDLHAQPSGQVNA